MPRKTKEQKEIEENKSKSKVATAKKTTVKSKSTTTKATTKSKSATAKTTTKSKSATAKATAKLKSVVAKVATKSKSATTKATTKSKSTTTKASSSTKKSPTKEVSTASTTTKKSTSTKKKIDIVEYYDLPYRYNQTVVKVLAQTPTNLFIYWDISDKDRNNFEKQYGENFFENTKPVLIIHNNTLGYSFEVEINDFANSWYLHVSDSKCDYKIELGRRPIFKTEKLNTDYIYITTSNEIESPNDRILYDANQKMVYFRNLKTGIVTQKDISSISFIRNMGKIYNIYDLYKAIYNNENIEEFYDLKNPSSGNPSSNSFSSRFK